MRGKGFYPFLFTVSGIYDGPSKGINDEYWRTLFENTKGVLFNTDMENTH